MRNCCAFLSRCLAFVATSLPLAAGDLPNARINTIFGATSDYVYRGVSQRNGNPTLLAYFSIKYADLYLDGFLVGVDLGEDGLGRSLGNIESDFTIGYSHRWDIYEFNIGAKYTGYPNGRDLVAGTVQNAERDFIEPFVGGKAMVMTGLSLGGTIYWTPDYYYQTGDVRTLEGQLSLDLPQWGGLTSKVTASVGWVRSDHEFVVSPGNGYRYQTVGVEGQLEHLIFDVRYWNTSVDQFEAFEQRLVVSAGVAY